MAIPIVRLDDEEGLRRGLKRVGPYRKFFLREIKAGTSQTAPAVVFVPGFLSDNNDRLKGVRCWETALTQVFAKSDASVFILHWQAGALPSFGGGKKQTSKTEDRAAVAAAVAAAAVVSPSFAGRVALPLVRWLLMRAVGVLGSVAIWFFSMFLKRTKIADEVAWHLYALPSELGLPVLLLGHSLGGRICLKSLQHAAEVKGSPKFSGCIAFAPAVTCQEIRLRTVVQGSNALPVVWYSAGDLTLRWPFRAYRALRGQFRYRAIGYKAPRKQAKIRFRKARNSSNRLLGHNDYTRELPKLMEQIDWAVMVGASGGSDRSP